MPSYFPDMLQHSEVADGIRAKVQFPAEQPVSAGFVSREPDGTYKVYGESLSLNLKSNPLVDNRLVNRLLKTSQ